MIQGHGIEPSVFSKSSRFLALVLGYLIYLELLCVYGVRYGFIFILLHVDDPVVPALF